MIKGILLTISIILLIAFAGLAIWQGIIFGTSKNEDSPGEEAIQRRYQKELDKHSRWDNDYTEVKERLTKEMNDELAKYRREHKVVRKGQFGFFTCLPLAIVLLAFTVCIPSSFHQVEAGTVAVVKELGKIVDIRTPGTYFDFYMTRHYETYDTTVQQVQIKTAAYSHDAQTMDLELYLQYQIQLDKLIIKDSNGNIIQSEGIAGKYVTLSSLQARIETQCIEKTKAVMSAEHFYEPNPETGEYPSNDFAMRGEEIIRHRADVSNKVSAVVRDAIGSDYYVTVQDVVLTNIDFTDEFEKSVEDKVIAEQQKQAAITRAEAELEVARIEAQKKIEEARGNAEAQKILAQASAEAATYKIIELARVIGYQVNETYLYSVDGVEKEFSTKQAESDTVIYLGTKYVIDIETGPGKEKFKELVEDYLKYLAYLEQWDGKLPDVVAGDDALSIIVPGSN